MFTGMLFAELLLIKTNFGACILRRELDPEENSSAKVPFLLKKSQLEGIHEDFS
jgi:hypothetical protein